MKILLISSKFFGYSTRVSSAFRSLGHDVDEITIPSLSFYERIKRKIVGRKTEARNRKVKQQLRKVMYNQYDTVFVFGGSAPLWLLTELKKRISSKYVLYLSADNSSYGFNSSYFSLFDKVFSYSRNDSLNNGFIYRPWFFSDELFVKKDVDICFIGSVHDDRYQYLSFLKKEKGLKTSFYIYIDRLGYIKIRKKWKDLKDSIHFTGLAYKDYITLLAKSRCTLDVPEKGQINITTRPIEALGTKTKIISTSRSIRDYDFYDENNILIIDDLEELNNISNWLNKPYVEVDENIVNTYRISKWAQDVLS